MSESRNVLFCFALYLNVYFVFKCYLRQYEITKVWVMSESLQNVLDITKFNKKYIYFMLTIHDVYMMISMHILRLNPLKNL